MIWSFRRWRRQRLLQRRRLPEPAWSQVLAQVPVLAGLSTAERDDLAAMALLFLYEKHICGVQGLVVTEALRLRLAAQASLPILALGIDWYRGFRTVLVYPSGFVVRHQILDDAGVVHEVVDELSGEAWDQGPVILSADGLSDGDGGNLVVHEFAHKLDMLNGAANGMPPLHAGMSPRQWSEAFAAAYEELGELEALGLDLPVDDYALESPAECFAVFSEAFFAAPVRLQQAFPAVYRQLCLFYRQDPAARCSRKHS